MSEYKTPGVYIKEKNAFGNSVVEAETAIPAFIGITEKAVNGTDSLVGKPWKITSMTEFYNYFGGMPKLELTVDIKKYHYLTPEVKDGKKLPEEAKPDPTDGLFIYTVRPSEETEEIEISQNQKEKVSVGYALCIDGKHPYSLYYNMLMFFANGGGSCYIVSVGTYDYDTYDSIDDKKVESALEALKLEREVTMIVVPEAATIEGYANIQQVMMKHCGEMANRFSILDVPQRNANTQLPAHIESFQNTVTNYFSYGAAYYPWLNTTVLSEKDIKESIVCYTNNFVLYHNKFSLADGGFDKIIRCLMTESQSITEDKTIDLSYVQDGEQWKNATKDFINNNIKTIEDAGLIVEKELDGETVKSITIKGLPKRLSKEQIDEAHAALFNGSSFYNRIIKGVVHALNQLPPSAAMAGIYTMVDNTRGVWKAPANVGLNYVDSLTESIGDAEQQDLNVPVTGKAINVIRSFRGEGNKVWGARTLDGNSQDWRYINVRRTMMFLEESVRNAARAYVFEPNDASTWINMKCMIENFLRSVWKRGGLAGATPEDAFEVHVGLGDTMTADDIQEGIMRITVLVAVSRPAEFIEITFQQQMQKS